MEILIPITAALIVYGYNYGKIREIKGELKIIKEMNEDKFWDKLESLAEKVAKIEVRIAKLETRVGIYSGAAVFISTIVVKFIDKFI